MKILVIGSGGREHALCWKLAQSDNVEKVIALPGNPGIAAEEKCECQEEIIDYHTGEGRARAVKIARLHDVDLTLVGPEDPLVQGIVDDFRKAGLKIIGPDKQAAQLEGSKDFAKSFMNQYNIRTPFSKTFQDYKLACEEIERISDYPIVIKADGLAAGKGVYICESKQDAMKALEEMMEKLKFGKSGHKVLIEEFIDGEEVSILALTDSRVIKPFLSSKDHKRLLDHDKGPNTGGMGVIAPNPLMSEAVYEDFIQFCLNPTLKGIRESGFDYRGIIFFGLMVKKSKCYVLEYNVRMGDPETQAVLPLMESDLATHLIHTHNGQLEKSDMVWNGGFCVNVVLASQGYPNGYQKGKFISGWDEPALQEQAKVFFAGVGKNDAGVLVNTGGRVLSVSSVDGELKKARQKAYQAIQSITLEGSFYRKDIGVFKD